MKWILIVWAISGHGRAIDVERFESHSLCEQARKAVIEYYNPGLLSGIDAKCVEIKP